MKLLEVDWGPPSGQQKVLPERSSSQRVEELKSKSPSDTSEHLQNKSCQLQASWKAKVDARPKAGQAQRSQTGVASGLPLPESPQDEAPGISFRSLQQKMISGLYRH